MDASEKAGISVIAGLGCLVLIFCGLMAWGFVELILWITSK